MKSIEPKLAKAENWERGRGRLYRAEKREMLQLQLGADTARLTRRALHPQLVQSPERTPEFAKLFDDTLRDIAIINNDIFSVKTDGAQRSPCSTS